MPESVVREKLESLNIRVQGAMTLRSGRRNQDPAKDRPPSLTSLYLWREDQRLPECDTSQRSAGYGGVVSGT
jgi:hypothetical protein